MIEFFDFQAKPASAWITVNRGCNFRCKWCYGQSTFFDPNDNMTLELAKHLVVIAKESGINYFTLIGGEPTIWEPLDDFISFCKSTCVKLGMITNGYRFCDNHFWEAYSKNPCDSVGVSVKSGNRSSFIEATGVDCYEETMVGIKRVMSLYNTGFSTVYNDLVGEEGLLEIAKNLRSQGAPSMTINLCSPVLGEEGISHTYSVSLQKTVESIMSMYPVLDNLYEGQVTFELFVPLCLFPESFISAIYEKGQLSSICHVHDRSGIVFDTNGDLLPCNAMIGNHIAKYGTDFLDGSSLLRHLNSDKLINDYRSLLRYPSEECSSCKWNRRCKGGCILNWAVFTPEICRAFK